MKLRSRSGVKVMVGLAAILLLAVSLAACGGGGSSNSGNSGSSNTSGSSSSSTITATEKEFSITLSDSTVKAGKVTFDIHNTGTVQHDIAVKGNGVNSNSGLIDAGKTKTWSVTLNTPGSYTIYCSVPGHEAQGMKTTLTVQ